EGRINIKQQRWRRHHRPLVEECDCPACTRYDASYIHHLFRAQELLGLRLASLHNLRFMAREIEAIRRSLETGTFQTAKRDFDTRYVPTARDAIKAGIVDLKV
ncbi:MAG: tRNA-guanine transglycosylase, partial [Thermomicrobiales bacterium]|nr:tRNA-guanine transglycosylase [Thermomicrobiales bacterium]